MSSDPEPTGFTLEEKTRAYAAVNKKLADFFGKYTGLDTISRMATLNSFLAYYFPHWHFVGYYVVKVVDGKKVLHIGPYQGKVLATAIIDFGRGQCGACAAEEKTQIQADVSTCANYIPCDDVTRSEIVVPVFSKLDDRLSPELIAVLDIDSEVLAAFDDVDKRELEALVACYLA